MELYNFLDEAVVILDEELRVIYVNTAFEALFRLSGSGARGRPLAKWLPRLMTPVAQEGVSECRRSEKPVHLAPFFYRAEELELELSLEVVPLGRHTGLLIRKLERPHPRPPAEPADSAFASAVLDSLPEGLLGLDANRRPVWLNARLVELLGYTPAELSSFDPPLPLARDQDDARWRDLSERLGSAAVAADECVELSLLTKSGDILIAGIMAQPLRVGEARWVLSVRDLSLTRVVEARQRTSDTLQRLGATLSRAAHEFNNLLTPVMGNLDLALRQPELDERTRRFVATAWESVEAASRSIHQLMTLARHRPLVLSPLDFNALVSRAAARFERSLSDAYSVRVGLGAEDPASVAGHRVELEQLVVNLCDNARNAMVDGGVITVTTRCVTITADYVRRHPQALAGRYWELAIGDDGVGIPEDEQGRVFEPFYTGRPGAAAGLGLARVYGVVSAHHGFVSLSSQAGSGTTVSVYIPAS